AADGNGDPGDRRERGEADLDKAANKDGLSDPKENIAPAKSVRLRKKRDLDLERLRNERVILFLVSLACIGLTFESVLLRWEFWVPPLILIGIVAMWAMNLTGKPPYEVRSVSYYVFAMLAVFYHGVHATSFFDVAIVTVLVMVAFSFMDHLFMMNLLLIEYAILMIIQLVLASDGGRLTPDTLNISRFFLHVTIVLLVYISCMKIISDRTESARVDKEKDERIESYDADMEDFLSNISHELRTPVNVVNGMSDLMIRRKAGDEADAIKNAGIRLSNQIEDIQDYTECKRNKVVLEEAEYISTSLINDVVAGFRLMEDSKDLELIVDLDPRVPSRMKGDLHKLHKIFRHLLENAVKFTRRGGIYVRMYSEETEYGVNLCIVMTDTGISMARRTIHSLYDGMYQVNKKRNRSSGGIGLGLFIVYGFVHKMGGFVRIESQLRTGTTVVVTIPQQVVDATPCIQPSEAFDGDVLFHVRSNKYKVPQVRDFYRAMAANLAQGIRIPLYPAETIQEIDRLREKLNVKVIFMGEEEYVENTSYFESLSKAGMIIAVSASPGFTVARSSGVIVMPKPLYAYPVMKIINEGKEVGALDFSDNIEKPVFSGVRALI
ncbi:MAG: HAMP domain-containing histidine kinase, partial [Lachnospiraceae bacterium]|nr:HAMP domain-containing histidine kinase [Lachnospiraceae bacterium]